MFQALDRANICPHYGYMTPKRMGASVAIFHQAEVLLIERAYEPMTGHWTFPGGRLEPGETIEQCARREVLEETGVVLGDLKPVEVQQLTGFELHVFAAALDRRPEIVASDEITGWRWLGIDDLAGLMVTPDLDIVLLAAQRILAER